MRPLQAGTSLIKKDYSKKVFLIHSELSAVRHSLIHPRRAIISTETMSDKGIGAMVNWSVTQEISKAGLTQVFSGGACNILDSNGQLLRNKERDPINDWLTSKNVTFFDPQIHPETHGIEYDYLIHSQLEIASRKAAKVNLYEVSPRTFGGVTSLEIAADYFRYGEPVVLFFSDGDSQSDRIPAHSKEGYPLFVPYGLHENAAQQHYKEMFKNANNMRRYLMHFAREMHNLTIMFGSPYTPHDLLLTSERIHAADIFEAVVKACRGTRISILIPQETKRDEKGTPIFSLQHNPPEMELHALLDQYVDEGNDLRERMAKLIGVNVFVRTVYTQRSAILALEEVMILSKIIQ